MLNVTYHYNTFVCCLYSFVAFWLSLQHVTLQEYWTADRDVVFCTCHIFGLRVQRSGGFICLRWFSCFADDCHITSQPVLLSVVKFRHLSFVFHHLALMDENADGEPNRLFVSLEEHLRQAYFDGPRAA